MMVYKKKKKKELAIDRNGEHFCKAVGGAYPVTPHACARSKGSIHDIMYKKIASSADLEIVLMAHLEMM